MKKGKIKDKVPIIVAVIEGLFLVFTTFLSVFFNSQAQELRYQEQQININVINSLGEQADGIGISSESNIEHITYELTNAYLNEVDKNKQIEDSQSADKLELQNLQGTIDSLNQENQTLDGQNKALAEENDKLTNQVNNLKGFILEKYSSSDVDRLVNEGFIKKVATVRLDNLEQLDGENYEQVSSVRDLYGTIHSTSYKMYARNTGVAWMKFKLAGKYDTFSAKIVTSQDTARNANMSVELYVDDEFIDRVDNIVRDENNRPININVNGGDVLMIKVVGIENSWDNICFITDTEISVLN